MSEIKAEVKIDGNLLLLDTVYHKQLVNAVAAMGAKTTNEIKKLSQKESFIDRTGNLRQSILPTKVNERELSIRVIAHKLYGRPVNDGWHTRKGKPVRGYDGSHYMEKGLFKAKKYFNGIIIQALNPL